MKRAKTNYWVDMITGVAFLFCAVTGLLRLFPDATVSVSSAGQPVILGIGMSVWQTVHDWSGVVMAAGVGVHTALHFKWLVAMTGKMVRGKSSARQAKTAATAAATQATPQATRLAAMQAAPHVETHAAPMAATQSGAAGSLARLEAMSGTSPQTRDARPLYTRKGFLAAAGVVGAATLLTGWSLLGRGDESVATSLTAGSADEAADGADSHTGSDEYDLGDDAGTSASSNDSTEAGASSGDSTGGAVSTSTSSARVVIDPQACTGCGDCVQTCPYGVFTMSGGKAVVQNADACRLCGHCLRHCAPGAITLNT